MNKLISVIMPVKNGEKYIKEAIENIKKQKMNIEIIVVNDASCDNTEKIAKELNCIVINNEKSQGPVKAKNQALKIAKGDYVLFHDCDDIMRENALKMLYDTIEKNSQISAVEAKVKDFLSPDATDKKAIVKKEPYWGLFTGAILVKKSAFDIIKGFDESVKAGEIIDWQGKMEENNLKIEKIDFVSTNRRIHDTNFGKTSKNDEFKDYAKLLRMRIKSGGGAKGFEIIQSAVSLFRSSSFVQFRKTIDDNEHKKNVEEFLKNLDNEALKHAKNLTDKLEKLYLKPMIALKQIYSQEELDELDKVKEFENSIEKTKDGYKWKNYILPIKLFESSVFYYRHGIDRLKNKKYAENKTILDCGGFIADSALVFRDEFPNSKIISFEPLKSNFLLAQKTLKLNNTKEIYLENYALGDRIETLKMKTFDTNLKNIESSIQDDGDETIKVTTIDSYVKSNNLKIGLIKTDVEGFEQKLLKGAKETITKQKPILLISIYHNYEDFYKIKPMIESWDLGYKFDVFQGVQNSGDITVETLLIAQI